MVDPWEVVVALWEVVVDPWEVVVVLVVLDLWVNNHREVWEEVHLP